MLFLVGFDHLWLLKIFCSFCSPFLTPLFIGHCTIREVLNKIEMVQSHFMAGNIQCCCFYMCCAAFGFDCHIWMGFLGNQLLAINLQNANNNNSFNLADSFPDHIFCKENLCETWDFGLAFVRNGQFWFHLIGNGLFMHSGTAESW